MDLKDREGPQKKRDKEEDIKGPTKEDDPCAFCASFEGRQGRSETRFMTDRELKALRAMREIKKEVGGIKQRMKEMERELEIHSSAKSKEKSGPSEPQTEGAEEDVAADLLESCDRLYRLKKEWEDWDEERMAAAEERMRLLGHIQ